MYMTDYNLSIRLANWDLLRSLAMFLVVVVHASGSLGTIRNFNMGHAVGIAALICDLLFFFAFGLFCAWPN